MPGKHPMREPRREGYMSRLPTRSYELVLPEDGEPVVLDHDLQALAAGRIQARTAAMGSLMEPGSAEHERMSVADMIAWHRVQELLFGGPARPCLGTSR